MTVYSKSRGQIKRQNNSCLYYLVRGELWNYPSCCIHLVLSGTQQAPEGPSTIKRKEMLMRLVPYHTYNPQFLMVGTLPGDCCFFYCVFLWGDREPLQLMKLNHPGPRSCFVLSSVSVGVSLSMSFSHGATSVCSFMFASFYICLYVPFTHIRDISSKASYFSWLFPVQLSVSNSLHVPGPLVRSKEGTG